jgi:hypothetical protein
MYESTARVTIRFDRFSGKWNSEVTFDVGDTKNALCWPHFFCESRSHKKVVMKTIKALMNDVGRYSKIEIVTP